MKKSRIIHYRPLEEEQKAKPADSAQQQVPESKEEAKSGIIKPSVKKEGKKTADDSTQPKVKKKKSCLLL